LVFWACRCLGFIDNAYQACKFDQAFALIAVTGVISMSIDSLSLVICKYLRLSQVVIMALFQLNDANHEIDHMFINNKTVA
jgi:hypothetical protein